MDIFSGILLAGITFLLFFLERAFLSRFLPQGPPPSQEVINLMTSLAQDPVRLAIWLGPVVWIGVAMFEEVSRVFFLNCLWGLGRSKLWMYLSIIIVSGLIGAVHLYQGAFGIVSVGIQSLVLGLYYYKYGRIWPLIISHAIYDSVQILQFVVMVN